MDSKVGFRRVWLIISKILPGSLIFRVNKNEKIHNVLPYEKHFIIVKKDIF